MSDGTDKEASDLVPLEEERAVIQRLKQGDRQAVAVLYGWYGDKLYRQSILPRLPVVELAEDCLRDTFRTVLERIDSFQDQNRSIFHWMRRIAINKAMDVYRRHQRDRKLVEKVQAQPEPLHQQPAAPDRGLEVDDLKRDVALSLSRLNERYALALRLRLLEERSREECAEIMGVKVGNFDVILHRAAKAFRQEYPP